MSLRRISSYLLSDDFDRFWELLLTRVPVIYASAKNGYKLTQGTIRNFSIQRWTTRTRFCAEQIYFLDPETQFNPETQQVIPITIDYALSFKVPDESKYTLCKQIWHDVVTYYSC